MNEPLIEKLRFQALTLLNHMSKSRLKTFHEHSPQHLTTKNTLSSTLNETEKNHLNQKKAQINNLCK